ncbi:uncharacterized protein LOC131944330 [Physella acuta]|uniref:uncharacterized protein LOC131944330 n=1 Tax=Physella acuta TaxID=109671 RepID=UPI0027DB0C27|nr:uncharacterized protein LOC131944330 [Physella acuta]
MYQASSFRTAYRPKGYAKVTTEASIKLKEGKLDSQSGLEGASYANGPGKVTETNPTVLFHPGNHEAQMCYEGEGDLHKHVTGCKKNPGHKGFIPLKDFNSGCLPSRYHDEDLMSETIKTLAALTVQVKTKFTSLERPEFYPGTLVPYPFYNDKGSHVMRLGTGRICWADKYTDSKETCRCAKCQVSATPSKVWGEVCVLTATHVVFDDSEARQTSCILGFDDNTRPGVSLNGWKVSVGQWTRKEERVDGHIWTRYWYTTSTCPGSSGAPIFMLGYCGRLYRHSHSASNSEGNYSGEWRG